MHEIINLIYIVLDLYKFLLLGAVLMSWINPDPYNPIVRFLRRATDPVLLPFRKLLMPLTMQLRIDLSPILAFLLIGMIQRVLRQLQYGGLDPAMLGRAVVDGLLVFFVSVFIFLAILMVARTFVEWTNADRWNPIVRFITTVTDPIVWRFRNFRGKNSRYDMRPVAATVFFLLGYAIVTALRGLMWR